MASPFTLPAILNPPLTGRDAVVDAVFRCSLAFDTADVALFDSSFMVDGVFEVNGHPWRGVSAVHADGLARVFNLDTTNHVTNVRVNMKARSAEGEQNEASLTATAFAQHYALGKGVELGQQYLMGGSLWRGDLVKDNDGLWKFKHLNIKANWVEGDWIVAGGSFAKIG